MKANELLSPGFTSGAVAVTPAGAPASGGGGALTYIIVAIVVMAVLYLIWRASQQRKALAVAEQLEAGNGKVRHIASAAG